MPLRQLLAYAQREPDVGRLAAAAEREPQRVFASASLRPYLLAGLLDLDPQRPALVIAGDDRAARDLAGDLKAYLAPREVRFYPSRGVRYESSLTPPPHLVGLRIAALDALVPPNEGLTDLHTGDAAVVVASATALSEKVPDPELRPHGFTLDKGSQIDVAATLDQLVACGYERVDQVEERGQFALRGDILDIYPATEERAVRCELFDVEVERLTWFSTFTQRSLEDAEHVEIEPAAELAPEHRELAEMAAESAVEDRPDIAQVLPLDRFRALLDLIPPQTQIVVAAEEDVGPSLEDWWKDVCTSFHDEEAHQLYQSPELLEAQLRERAALWVSSISGDQPHVFRAQAADAFARSLPDAEPELEKLVRSGYRTVVAWGRRGEAERALYNLARVDAQFLDGHMPEKPTVMFATAALREGFVWPSAKVAILPEHRLLRRRRGPERSGPSRNAMTSFTELRANDPVVHEDHGIARFLGFETKTVGGVTRDYLELEYRDGDRVFVPSDQLHKISRYVGADASDPQLSSLGGKQWERQKLRARRAAQALAGELINLYAERKRRAGYAFPSDSEWEREFEASFPYQETPDQLEAIEQVRADMEEARPMDRLICGDVGYGKTEVALRASFKAAEDGKQVMFLVPTTVLAAQHYGTFVERMRDYPFRIKMASRFRKPAEVRQALADFSEGKVDILIGTHRLLSQDVRPKDLGLLVVDEEQRFGVKQKELLRQLRLKVDVLSLSATPIPRTLQMSLAGLRDISVIEDATGGTPSGAHLRGRVRRGPGQAGDRARARASRPDVLPAQPRRDDRRDGHPHPGARARSARARGARPDGRGPARARDDGLPARHGRRARVHLDRRVRARHPEREHADRGPRRHARAGADVPDTRPRRALARAGICVPALPVLTGAVRGRAAAAVDAL